MCQHWERKLLLSTFGRLRILPLHLVGPHRLGLSNRLSLRGLLVGSAYVFSFSLLTGLLEGSTDDAIASIDTGSDRPHLPLTKLAILALVIEYWKHLFDIRQIGEMFTNVCIALIVGANDKYKARTIELGTSLHGNLHVTRVHFSRSVK
jgi:hypothetical protein